MDDLGGKSPIFGNTHIPPISPGLHMLLRAQIPKICMVLSQLSSCGPDKSKSAMPEVKERVSYITIPKKGHFELPGSLL